MVGRGGGDRTPPSDRPPRLGRHPERRGERKPGPAAGRAASRLSPSSTPSGTRRRRPWSRWPASAARSPSPPTWPVAGTDIKWGPGVAGLGGLHVLATERHESGRVDRQFFGRAGRQGDPGSSQAFLSAEDELVRRFLPPAGRWALERATRVHFRGWRGLARAVFGATQSKGAARSREAAPERAALGHLARRGPLFRRVRSGLRRKIGL